MIFNFYPVYKKYDYDKKWRANEKKITSIIAIARINLLPIVCTFGSKIILPIELIRVKKTHI